MCLDGAAAKLLGAKNTMLCVLTTKEALPLGNGAVM